MNKKNTRKGFTIVELVIVIAVIAILATVLIPTFGDIIAKANKSAALQEARNEFTEYMIDNAATGNDDVIIKVTVKETDYYFAVVNGKISETAYPDIETEGEVKGALDAFTGTINNAEATQLTGSTTIWTVAPAAQGNT